MSTNLFFIDSRVPDLQSIVAATITLSGTTAPAYSDFLLVV